MTALRFAGYAAIFNRLDNGGDIIRPGAFGTLKKGQTLPLLWQHQPQEKIGAIEQAYEDSHGLRVIGSVNLDTRTGREAARFLVDGTVNGLSFGYRVENAFGAGPRILLGLDVAEISLVSRPMQSLARVHSLA